MPLRARRPKRATAADLVEFVADVVVIGGGPAGAWAALAARATGCEVILADKGFLGTSGATAPSNTESWAAPPGATRENAVARQVAKSFGRADPALAMKVLETSWIGLNRMAEWAYPFPRAEDGGPYLGNLRGPDYMRFLRRRVIGAGVLVLDHHPALELIADGVGITGAAGIDRQRGNAWRARASAVVLATGGCALGERFIGATGLTGDGHLMAVEAGAVLSGMEYSSQYAVAPAGSSLNKGMPYRFATFTREDGSSLGDLGDERQTAIAKAILEGPVYACLDKCGERERDWLVRGQPNCFLPFERSGIDPFKDRFAVTLRAEGTVRGVGGVRLVSEDCRTDVAGLFAAGDVASREALCGPVSGGGGPNASWAIASGTWAGAAAGELARRHRAVRDRRSGTPRGRAGMQPLEAGMADTTRRTVETVRSHMLPVALNFFRDASGLAASRDAMEGAWTAIGNASADRLSYARGAAAVHQREAAALVAASRWMLTSAMARHETCGTHRRKEYPAVASERTRILARGIDRIEIAVEGVSGGERPAP